MMVFRKNDAPRVPDRLPAELLLAAFWLLGTAAYLLLRHFAWLPLPAEAIPDALPARIWHFIKPLLIVFLCSYTALGVPLIPLVFASRGFLLAAAVQNSAALPQEAFSALLPLSLVSAVCLFLLGRHGLHHAYAALTALTHRRAMRAFPGFAARQALRFLLTLAAITAAAFLGDFFAPQLAAWLF